MSNQLENSSPPPTDIKSEPAEEYIEGFGSTGCIRIETVHGFEIKCEVDDEQVVQEYSMGSDNCDNFENYGDVEDESGSYNGYENESDVCANDAKYVDFKGGVDTVENNKSLRNSKQRSHDEQNRRIIENSPNFSMKSLKMSTNKSSTSQSNSSRSPETIQKASEILEKLKNSPAIAIKRNSTQPQSADGSRTVQFRNINHVSRLLPKTSPQTHKINSSNPSKVQTPAKLYKIVHQPQRVCVDPPYSRAKIFPNLKPKTAPQPTPKVTSNNLKSLQDSLIKSIKSQIISKGTETTEKSPAVSSNKASHMMTKNPNISQIVLKSPAGSVKVLAKNVTSLGKVKLKDVMETRQQNAKRINSGGINSSITKAISLKQLEELTQEAAITKKSCEIFDFGNAMEIMKKSIKSEKNVNIVEVKVEPVEEVVECLGEINENSAGKEKCYTRRSCEIAQNSKESNKSLSVNPPTTSPSLRAETTYSNATVKKERTEETETLVTEFKIKEEVLEDYSLMINSSSNVTNESQNPAFLITNIKTEMYEDDNQYSSDLSHTQDESYSPQISINQEDSHHNQADDEDIFQYNIVNSFKSDLATRRSVLHTVVSEKSNKSKAEIAELARQELLKLEKEKQLEKEMSAAGLTMQHKVVDVPLNVHGTRMVTKVVLPGVKKLPEAVVAHQCPVCLIKFKTFEQLTAHKRIHDVGKAKLNTAEMTKNVYDEVKMKIEQIGNRRSFHVLMPQYDYAFVVTNSTAKKIYMKCFRQNCDVKAYSTNDGKFFLKRGDNHTHGPDRDVIISKITEAKMNVLEKTNIINKQVHMAIIEKEKQKNLLEERKSILIERIKKSQQGAIESEDMVAIKKRRLC